VKQFLKKVVLVTGAGRGIGRAIAAAFAAEGARLVICARTKAELESAALEFQHEGAEVVSSACDLRDRAAVDKLVETAMERWGRIDVLVNNAAVFPKRIPFLEQSYDDWNDVLQINVMGTFHITQSVVRAMVASGKPGRIVNISSINSTKCRVDATGATQYGASKAALDHITKALALELAPHGILVNGLALGFVRTNMAADDGLESEEFLREYIHRRRIPVGRVGNPADCANMVLFLASERCAWITGETIHQDGGMHFTF
jgi:NAD(P)-dependent dehydrogenase (short-subunit alcohol dehydrogenase family)